MGGEPNKRRMTWFAKPRPGTLGQMWQRMPQDGQENDMRLARRQGAPENPASRQPDWNGLPPLPKWPPLAGEDRFASGDADADAPTTVMMPLAKDSSGATGSMQDPPLWEHPAPDRSGAPHPSRHTLWERFRSSSRRTQVGVIAIGCVVLLCSGLGTAALGNALGSNSLTGGANSPGARGTGNASMSPTAANATPSVDSGTATAAPNLTPTVVVPPLTVTFTCASGTAGGKGQVCVHTEANAAVSLEVRYCDGSFANGKGLRGSPHTDGNGNYTWSWNVTTSCIGTATATVTARSAGRTVTQSTTFTITR